MSASRTSVVRALVREVADGRLEPGEPFPTDGELAHRFEVSPDIARGAMSDLQDLGFARPSAEHGAVVGSEAEWDVLDPIVVEAMLASDQGGAIVAEYLEYRRIVEVVAAGLAAQNATVEDLDVLSESLGKMTVAAELPASP